MKVIFHPPSEEEFLQLFVDSPTGGSLVDIKYFKPSPRGTGLFGLLAGLARKAAPFLVKKALPSGLNLIQNVAEDVLAGKNFKSSIKKRGVKALGEVRDKIISGAGRRKRKRPQNRQRKRGRQPRRGKKKDSEKVTTPCV